MDASTKNLYVIILKDGKVFGGRFEDCLKLHSETMIPRIDKVLIQSGLTLRDIDIYACGIGCGSFTGIRVAISTVKGLNAACPKKLVQVNTLETFAYTNDGRKEILMDAGGGRWYYAAYENGVEAVKPAVLSGETAELVKNSDGCEIFDEDADLTQRLVDAVCFKIARGEYCAALRPLYLRKSQAEELRTAKNI